MAPPPSGLAVNGLREISNATAKPDPAVQRPVMRVTPDDELAVNSKLGVNNNAGAIGAAYNPNVPHPHSPSGISTNGRDEATQQAQGGQGAQGGQQAPKFAATLSDLMSSFKTAGLKGNWNIPHVISLTPNIPKTLHSEIFVPTC